jgi:hypothetical protein
LKLVCYSLKAIADSDDEHANTYECKKPLVEIRSKKEIAKSKKEVDIAFSRLRSWRRAHNMFLPSQASASADNVAVWQKSKLYVI